MLARMGGCEVMRGKKRVVRLLVREGIGREREGGREKDVNA